MNPKPRILFLCTGNSCRSQMAEGFARALRPDALEPYSAGVERHGMNPLAVRVMAEAGIDISGQKSKLVSELPTKDFDYVITLCTAAQGACPGFSGRTTVVHHAFDDPPSLAAGVESEEKVLEIYRRVRDEIKEFVLALPDNLPDTNEILLPSFGMQ